VTFILTTDENDHLAPISAAISENIQANTIEGVLRRTKAKIEARARGIVEGSVAIEDREEHHKAEIVKNAKRVVDSLHGFQPRIVMIDKSRAEKCAAFEGT